ncbi:energy transducer TonB [Bartonella bacilliformis]|uniref:energy transducer TonB family protein n=1 Tax=Bartonella bacilliformis TaxID=774 RepID=UPI0007AF053E|nr:TonB family protein [Bartonella bacilliformis]KZM37866.1 energy transducer TonB [Bartonella bacilliformis]
MNDAITERLSTLWVGAFIVALSLHVALGVQFYFQNVGAHNYIVSPSIMLAFEQEIIHPDLSIDTDLEVLQDDFVKLDHDMLEPVLHETQPEEFSPLEETLSSEKFQSTEELQSITEKNDFMVPKPLKKSSPLEREQENIIQKSSSVLKAKIRKSDEKTIDSFTSSKQNNAEALDDALSKKWLAEVQAQLERQKKYIMRQRIRRVKGVVRLEFKVHEQGNIFASRIALSSGDQELDRLAMAALRRVVVPPPPLSKMNETIRVFLIFN